MSRKNLSKEFKLKLLKEHDEKWISYWKLGKEYGIEASIIRRWGYAYATLWLRIILERIQRLRNALRLLRNV